MFQDYTHFYGQGGEPDETRVCPLWSQNDELHRDEVLRGGQEAKNIMDREQPDVVLKNDPTLDLGLP